MAGWLGLSGCSSSDSASNRDPDPEAVATSDSPAVATEDSVANSGSVTTESSAAERDDGSQLAEEETDDEASTTAEPLRPTGEPQPTSLPEAKSTSAYISRLSMTSRTIEVNWSETEGVAEYQIHRIPRTSDDEPPLEAMTSENLIYVTDAGGRFADEGVVAGTEYWHGVREFSADGDITAHGWHRTVAIDDEEPPSTVEVTAVAENGGVLVSWVPPDENYQLHGYRVFRGVDGEVPESIAVTWNLDQISFIDDEPPTSTAVVYEVVAFDFHWNKSAPGRVTIDLS